MKQIERTKLFEVYNGHHAVNTSAAAACRVWKKSGIACSRVAN